MALLNIIKYTHPAITDEEGDKIVMPIQAETIVCPECHGGGSHFRRDLDENRLVESMEEDGDEDGLEAYHRGGFSQTCTECKGRNVIQEVNWKEFAKKYPKEQRKINAWHRDEDEDMAYSQSERAFCGGGY